MTEKRRGRQLSVGSNVPVGIPDFASGTEPDAVRNKNRYISIDGALVRSNGSVWSAVGLADVQDTTLALDFSSGDVVLTEEQFADNFRFTSDADLTVARNLTAGTPSPQYFVVANPQGSSNDLTMVIGTSTSPVAPGVQATFYADGSANGLVRLGSTEFAFDDLTDTPANKTGQKGRRAGVNDAETDLIYLSDDPVTFDLSSGNAVATDVQMIANYQFGPAAALTAARSITLPATLPKPFQAFNQSGSTNDLTITIGATSLAVAPGEQRLFYADGTTNGLVALTDNGPSAFSGAKVSRFSTDQTLTTDTPTIAQYDLEEYDVGSWADLGANNDRLVVPAGVSRAKITAGSAFDSNATGGRNVQILINGTTAGSQQVQASASAGTTLNVSSAEEPVSPTDIIQARVTQRSGGNLNVAASENTFLAAVAIA